MSFTRTEENTCSFVNPETGKKCQALKMKSSKGGYCVGHSRMLGEELSMFGGSIVQQIENGYYRKMFEDSEGSIESWEPWLAILSAQYGLPMSPEREETFRKLSGNRTPPTKQVKQAWDIFGRRTGKSWMASVQGTYLCLFRKYPQLRRGERGWVAIVSPTRDMSRTIMDYTKEILLSVPKFKEQVEKIKSSEILLSNGTGIATFTSNNISVRSKTLIAGILEECAFLDKQEYSNPDIEILNALVPCTATIPNAIIIGISSPYSRDGLLFNMFSQFYGSDSQDILVCNGATRDLNPTISQEWIDAELARDYERNKAELLGRWRDDVSQWLDGELLNQCVDLDRGNLPPKDGVRYVAFTDGASGSSNKNASSFTLCIGTKEDEKATITGIWEWKPPFRPSTVCKEISDILKQYRIHSVTGDKWAVGALADLFRQHGIVYHESKLNKSELYLESAVFFHSGQVRLPDNKRLLQQLRSLERHTMKSGKDQVAPGLGARDDVSNSCCGVICELLLGLHLSLDDPELLSRLPQTSRTVNSASSIDRMTPWEREEKIKSGEILKVMIEGRLHYLRASIDSKLGLKEKQNDSIRQ